MEGFVFDLQRFATVYSSNISSHNEGYLIPSASGDDCIWQESYSSGCIARVLGNREILVNRDTQITFKFDNGDTNTYVIKSTNNNIYDTYTVRGAVEITGTGANPYSGSGLTIGYTDSYGSTPIVTGFDPVYYNAFTLADVYVNHYVHYSVQTSYDDSTFVAAKSNFGSTTFIVGASNSATAGSNYYQSFSLASLSLADVLRAATAVGYTPSYGYIGIKSYDSATHKTIWSNEGAAGFGTLTLTSNEFVFYETGGQITISVGAGTIGAVTILNANATLDASDASASTGLISVASGAKVKVKNNGVWISGAAGSVSQVASGVMTLKSGTFTGSGNANIVSVGRKSPQSVGRKSPILVD